MRLSPRPVALVTIAALAPAFSLWFIRQIPPLHRAELLLYDWHAGSLPVLPADDRLVLVGMDAESLQHLPLAQPTYPLPRRIHARLVTELHAAGAKIIAFDVVFTREVPSDDATFAAALQAAQPVLSGAEPSVRIVDGVEVVTFTKPSPALRPYLTACSILAPPILGKIRWLLPYVSDANTTERYQHLTVALARALGADTSGAPRGGDGEILIRFAGPPGTFVPLPISQVFDGSWRSTRGPDFFRDKAVLIGIIDPFVDRALTPMGNMQGAEVLLHATQTALQGNWIRPWTQAENFLLSFMLCAALVLAVLKFGARWALAAWAAEVAVWVTAAHWLFVHGRIWADSLGPITAAAVTMAAAGAYEAARVRQVFNRFMPSRVAEHMIDASPGEAAATREIEATIVFCDVRQSTTLAEELPPDQMEALMRRYFTAGEEAAHANGAELDKFVGDEIMLYFDERRGLDRHTLRAVRWAFDLLNACDAITESGLAGKIGFRVGIGMCTGRVRLGTVGAKQRIQHTVMGDAVNTASRIQALTRDLNRSIIVDETTWVDVSSSVDGEAIGPVAIRGKQQPVALYGPTRLK